MGKYEIPQRPKDIRKLSDKDLKELADRVFQEYSIVKEEHDIVEKELGRREIHGEPSQVA